MALCITRAYIIALSSSRVCEKWYQIIPGLQQKKLPPELSGSQSTESRVGLMTCEVLSLTAAAEAAQTVSTWHTRTQSSTRSVNRVTCQAAPCQGIQYDVHIHSNYSINYVPQTHWHGYPATGGPRGPPDGRFSACRIVMLLGSAFDKVWPLVQLPAAVMSLPLAADLYDCLDGKESSTKRG